MYNSGASKKLRYSRDAYYFKPFSRQVGGYILSLRLAKSFTLDITINQCGFVLRFSPFFIQFFCRVPLRGALTFYRFLYARCKSHRERNDGAHFNIIVVTPTRRWSEDERINFNSDFLSPFQSLLASLFILEYHVLFQG